ncbi:hypothetical protein EV182_003663 [Spiromyces aspiralis]|uniref:Uncharacterized protein n=1 Tax=Spiromyces aspiralis TaxID=68401 RepID=A0ACC1HF47_9FUNG|nr:hypothetical protein EV182_003663 [Spiromyces aspiralis]
MSSKYANLPDIDLDQPDVYETPDPVEADDSLHPASEQASASPPPPHHCPADAQQAEEALDPNVSVEGIQARDALTKFQRLLHNSDASDDPKSVMARHKRALFRTYLLESLSKGGDLEVLTARSRPAGSDKEGQDSIVSPGWGTLDEETPQQRLRRLVYETHELAGTMQRTNETRASSKTSLDVTLLSTISELQHQLTILSQSVDRTYGQDGQRATSLLDRELLDKLCSIKSVHEDQEIAEAKTTKAAAAAPSRDRPGLGTHMGDIGDLEQRLVRLEKALFGPSQSQQVTGTDRKGITATISSLEERVSLLTDPRMVEGISRRAKQLIVELDRLKEQQQQQQQQQQKNLVVRSAQDGKAEGGEGAATVRELDQATVNRINDLFEHTTKLETLIELAPAVSARLQSLSQLHTEAASVVDTLKRAEESNERVDQGIGMLTDLCQSLMKSIAENSEVMQDNVRSLDERMDSLVMRIEALGK